MLYITIRVAYLEDSLVAVRDRVFVVYCTIDCRMASGLLYGAICSPSFMIPNICTCLCVLFNEIQVDTHSKTGLAIYLRALSSMSCRQLTGKNNGYLTLK